MPCLRDPELPPTIWVDLLTRFLHSLPGLLFTIPRRRNQRWDSASPPLHGRLSQGSLDQGQPILGSNPSKDHDQRLLRSRFHNQTASSIMMFSLTLRQNPLSCQFHPLILFLPLGISEDTPFFQNLQFTKRLHPLGSALNLLFPSNGRQAIGTHSLFLAPLGPLSLLSKLPKNPFMFSVLAEVFFSNRSAMSFFSASQLLADFR